MKISTKLLTIMFVPAFTVACGGGGGGGGGSQRLHQRPLLKPSITLKILWRNVIFHLMSEKPLLYR